MEREWQRADRTLADEARRRTTRTPRRIEPLEREASDEAARRPRQRRQQPVERSTRATGQRYELRELLHSHDSLRRAIILSEILGPPKALRQDE